MSGKDYKKELIQKAVEQGIDAYFADMEKFTADNLPALAAKRKSISDSIDQQIADLGNKYENIEELLEKEREDSNKGRTLFSSMNTIENSANGEAGKPSLTEEEKNTLSSYRREKKTLEKKKDADLKATNEDSAFHKVSCVSLEFGQTMLDAYEAQKRNKSLKVDPVQAFLDLESPNFTEQDKLDTLFFVQRYIDKVAIPRQDIPAAGSSLSAEEMKAVDAKYERLNNFGSKYGLFRLKTAEDGSKELKSNLYMDDASAAIQSIGSGLRYKADRNDPQFNLKSYHELKDFCKEASEKLLLKMAEKGKIEIKGEHAEERNKYFEQLDQNLKDLNAIDTAVGNTEKDGKSVIQSHLDKTKLSFGRKGSPEFQNMKSAYEALQEKLKAYAEDPGRVDSAKLREQMKEVSAKAAEYLNMKNNAMDKGDVSFKVDQATGKRVAKNSNTKNRMEFAEFLKNEADRMNKYFEEKAAAPAKKLKETFDHARENIKEDVKANAKKSLMTFEDLKAENAKKKAAPVKKSKVSLLIERGIEERKAKENKDVNKVIQKYDLNAGKGKTKGL